eukprot:7826116-Pyramimonas_sp.AAC.1
MEGAPVVASQQLGKCTSPQEGITVVACVHIISRLRTIEQATLACSRPALPVNSPLPPDRRYN